MELKGERLPEQVLREALGLGIHSMELKDISTRVRGRAVATSNPFNGIERVAKEFKEFAELMPSAGIHSMELKGHRMTQQALSSA